MAIRFINIDRRTPMLMPENIQDWVPENYISRFIFDAVELLDLSSFHMYGVGGNVWECTSKSPGGDFDAWRGASWYNGTQDALRCVRRRGVFGASYRDFNFGFRLLLFR